MKKVLMVACQFPPAGGSGVQRSLKFAKYLPCCGWEPVVLTREAGSLMLRDESLAEEIPDGIEVIRTPARDLTSLPGLLSKAGKFVSWKLLIPDGEVLWMRASLKAAIDRMGRGDIDALYTTSYPYSDHLMGVEIKDRYPDLPWVADFRDEWTNNPYYADKPHHAYRANKEREMEKKVLMAADRLIANTPVMKNNFVALNPGMDLEKRMSVIPNGFDMEDFESKTAERPRNEKFTVTYTGSLYGRRKPDIFLEAAGSLIRSGIINPEAIRIRFIGNFKREPLDRLAAANGLKGVVEAMPYMKHKVCVQSIVNSDLLLLLEGGLGSEAFYTGKLFEYIKAKRPILALVPEDGAAADLIRETRTGVVCDWSDVRRVEKGLADLYKSWTNNVSEYNPDEREIAKYDRRVLTEKLARILDEICIME